MPGDPAQCRLYAARYLELSERAQDPERRQNLAALAETWAKLAAELESEQALLSALSDLTLDEPSKAEGSEPGQHDEACFVVGD
jgi:hypothetical protein